MKPEQVARALKRVEESRKLALPNRPAKNPVVPFGKVSHPTKSERRLQRDQNRSSGVESIDFLIRNGYDVAIVNRNPSGAPIQFRVNGIIDIYPVNKKYCILPARSWGVVSGEITDFIVSFLANYIP